MKFEEYELERDWKEQLDYEAIGKAIVEQAIKEYKTVVAKGESKPEEWDVEQLENYINKELAPIAETKKGVLQKRYIMQEIKAIAGTIKERKKAKKIQNLVEYMQTYHKEWE